MSHPTSFRLAVKVVPGSSRTEVVGWLGDSLKIKVAAQPEKGKANAAVVRLLAKILTIDEADIAIVSGLAAQNKVLEINGATPQDIAQALPPKRVL